MFFTQSKTRGLTEEGGRLALSGQNGWAFFDYHLAMFGPQEVPLGPIRLQMALPPFGCDPGAYTVRIQGIEALHQLSYHCIPCCCF